MLSSTDIIIIVVLAIALIVALGYMGKQKKRGSGCIGCPERGHCAKRFTEEACKDSDK